MKTKTEVDKDSIIRPLQQKQIIITLFNRVLQEGQIMFQP